MRWERPEHVLIEAPALVRLLYGTRTEPDDQAKIKPLTAAAQQVLMAISEDPHRRVEDIAERLLLKSSTISNALRELKDHKLIREVPNPRHQRQMSRPLTKAGEAEVSRLIARARKLLGGHSKAQG